MINVRLGSAAGALAGVLFACALGAPAHAQFTTAGPEEAAVMAVGPETALPRAVYEAAGAYHRYLGEARAFSPEFRDGAAVASSVRAGAAYEPRQLTRGAVAYAAVVALQDPAFVRGVRERAGDPIARKEFAARLWRDPGLATEIRGAGSAAGLIVSAVSDEGARLRGMGDRIKQAAYDIQLQPWSKGEVADRDLRLAQVKTLSATPWASTAEDVQRLQSAALGAQPLRLPAAEAPSYTPVVQRGLAVAALAALGEAGENDLEALEGLLTEPECASCLRMAKLNLFQCLAVAKPWYEDVYCLGQHGVKDTGDCLAETTSTPWRPKTLAAAPAVEDRRTHARPLVTYAVQAGPPPVPASFGAVREMTWEEKLHAWRSGWSRN